MRKVFQEYPDKVRLVFKHFPLPGHRMAFPAARAAICAQEQGRFWEYHDKLFSAAPPLSNDVLTSLAGSLGLEKERFAECLQSERHSQTINDHVRDGQAATVRGTPTFVVNGQIFRGALSYEQWKSILDQQLQQGSSEQRRND